ncbi:OmpH family outer membrane protein [uncultured Prevotella sp.]|uniref:OmpH family outer membrane protein n=1 Tax=uncultured Prevotella sp. TaxID=159272 RepID=UPI0026250445|nr:OmpH family outer membrane protein [uncultured Prevotella sp.]
MKKLVLFLLLLLPAVAVDAQVKFGYLSYSEAIKAMPGYADMQKSLAELKRQYANETKRSEDEFNQKYESFLEGQKDFAPSILKKRQYELQELLNNSVSFKKEAARLLEQAEADMYAPLKKRLNEILRQMGRERGYAFILNTDNDAVPYIDSASGEDISTLVRNMFTYLEK